MDTRMYDGRKLRRIIAEQGRKARWISDQCGIHESLLSRIVSGERLASLELAQRIADTLGIPLRDAFDEVA